MKSPKLYCYSLNTINPSIADGSRVAFIAYDEDERRLKYQKIVTKANENLDNHQFHPVDRILSTKRKKSSKEVALVFPGFGSEYPKMISGITRYFPFLKSKLLLILQFLEINSEGKSVDDIEKIIEDKIINSSYGLNDRGPIGFITSLAYFEVIKYLEILPKYMIGHSNGENTALISTNTIEFKNDDELLQIIKSIAIQPQRDYIKGVYLGVSNIAFEEIEKIVTSHSGLVFIAMRNCPSQVVLYTFESYKNELLAILKENKAIIMEIPTDHPYHTSLFTYGTKGFKQVYETFKINNPTTPILSSADGQEFIGPRQNIITKALRQWVEPVLFQPTIESTYKKGISTFIEVGPNSKLSGFIRDTLRGKPHLAVSCSTERLTSIESILTMVANLWINSIPFNTSKVPHELIEINSKSNKHKPVTHTNATAQIFHKHQELMQSFLRLNQKITANFLAQSMNQLNLGIEKETGYNSQSKVIHKKLITKYKTINTKTHPHILDHTMGNDLIVIPFTMAIEIILESVLEDRTDYNKVPELSNIQAYKWLICYGQELNLKIEIDGGSETHKITLFSKTEDRFERVYSADYKAITRRPQSNVKIDESEEHDCMEINDFYVNHLFHGPIFRSIKKITHFNFTKIEADIQLPQLNSLKVQQISNQVPGVMLDTAGQILALWLMMSGLREFSVFPISVREYTQYKEFNSNTGAIRCIAKITKNKFLIEGEISYYNMNGECLAKFTKFQCRVYLNKNIPALLMNKNDEIEYDVLNADFLNEAGGIWSKILAKNTMPKDTYVQWLKLNEDSQSEHLESLINQKTTLNTTT